MTAAVTEQTGFAFYEDGTESGAAIIGSVDTDINRVTGNVFQVRLEVTNTGGMADNVMGTLFRSYQGGAYTRVDASSTVVQAAAGLVTDGEVTTERLAGPNAFTAGFVDEVDGQTANVNVDNSPQEDTEFLFSITIIDGDVNDGDTIDFRLYDGATAIDTYTITPRATVDKALSVDVGLATETDTGLTVTPERILSVGLPAETDAALTATPDRAVAAGLPLETDVALGVTPGRAVLVGLPAETDTALGPITTGVEVAVGLSVETDTALAVVAERAVSVGQSAETDAALAAQPDKSVTVGLVTEVDAALAVGKAKSKAVGLPAETDSALAVVAALSKTVNLGLATESELAFAIGSAKVKGIGLVSEIDSVLGLRPTREIAVGLPTAVGAALALSHSKAVQLGLPTEPNEALHVTIWSRQPSVADGWAEEAAASKPWEVEVP